MIGPLLIRCADEDAVAASAAAVVAECAQEAVEKRGRFTLVLAGGWTPAKTYRLLAEPGRAVAVPWSKTFVFLGDERLVPPDDPRSNFGMAQCTLLKWVPMPAEQVFPVPTERVTAAEAADAYAARLCEFFGAPPAGPPPRFDVILLGLGDDGHTASLFPGAAALDVTDAWVTSSPPGALPPFVDRVTMTYPVLNAARHVVFLVTGEKKAAVLRDVLKGGGGRGAGDGSPAARVRPTDGTLTWIVDEAAAGLLTPESVS